MGVLMNREVRKGKRRALAARVAEGQSVNAVAKESGVSNTTVYAACREFDVVVDYQPHGGIRGKNVAILASLMDAGRSLRDIADQHGCTFQRVHQVYEDARSVDFPNLPDRTPKKAAPEENRNG